ncbi:hypothetical protein JCM33774_37770 [Actinophytocola sp. KF-1]
MQADPGNQSLPTQPRARPPAIPETSPSGEEARPAGRPPARTPPRTGTTQDGDNPGRANPRTGTTKENPANDYNQPRRTAATPAANRLSTCKISKIALTCLRTVRTAVPV